MMFTKMELKLMSNIYELNVLEKQDITYLKLVNYILASNGKKANDNSNLSKFEIRIRNMVNTNLENLLNKGVLSRQRIKEGENGAYVYSFTDSKMVDLVKCLYEEHFIPSIAKSLSSDTCNFLSKEENTSKDYLINYNEISVYQLSHLQRVIIELNKNNLVRQNFIDKTTLSGKVLELNARGKRVSEYLQEMELENDNDIDHNI